MNLLQKSAIALAISSGLVLCNAAAADPVSGQVTKETAAARTSGELNAYNGEDSGSFHMSLQPWTSTRTRAEVVAELKAAQRRGEVAAMHCEDSGSVYLSRQGGRDAAGLIYAGPNAGSAAIGNR